MTDFDSLKLAICFRREANVVTGLHLALVYTLVIIALLPVSHR